MLTDTVLCRCLVRKGLQSPGCFRSSVPLSDRPIAMRRFPLLHRSLCVAEEMLCTEPAEWAFPGVSFPSGTPPLPHLFEDQPDGSVGRGPSPVGVPGLVAKSDQAFSQGNLRRKPGTPFFGT